jgi:hypothetical protein
MRVAKNTPAEEHRRFPQTENIEAALDKHFAGIKNRCADSDNRNSISIQN